MLIEQKGVFSVTFWIPYIFCIKRKYITTNLSILFIKFQATNSYAVLKCEYLSNSFI